MRVSGPRAVEMKTSSHSVSSLRLGVFLVALICGPAVPAHEGPEHEIETLTAFMARRGPTPLLLLNRAGEFETLGQFNRAIADLQAALKLDAKFSSALIELSRIHLGQGQTAAALVEVNRALELVPIKSVRASLHILRAEIRVAQGRDELALADCERAFQGQPGQIEWFLLRSQIQARLGQLDACAAGLKAGFEQTQSAVLETQWIEALIDAGRSREALALIEPQLAESRLKSSWLLRRARAHRALGEECEIDLHGVLEELNRRINPRAPDLTLLADRGLAFALLGKRAEAEKDLAEAKKRGAESWVVRRLEKILAESARVASLR